MAALCIGFEGWLFGGFIFDGPPSMSCSASFFVPKFTSLLMPSFIPAFACLSALLYPTMLPVLMTILAGINHAPGHTARFSLTFASFTASWYLCTLFAKSGCLIASSIRVKNSVWASFALPPSPSMLLLTFTCAPKIQ